MTGAEPTGVGEQPTGGAELTQPSPVGLPQVWDAERELEIDRRAERRLLVRELIVLMVIGGLVLLRILFVHGS